MVNCDMKMQEIVCENLVDCGTKFQKICVCFDYTKDILFKDQSENFRLVKRQASNYSFVTWRDSDSTLYNYYWYEKHAGNWILQPLIQTRLGLIRHLCKSFYCSYLNLMLVRPYPCRCLFALYFRGCETRLVVKCKMRKSRDMNIDQISWFSQYVTEYPLPLIEFRLIMVWNIYFFIVFLIFFRNKLLILIFTK